MIRPLIRVELWTDYRCRAGTRLGVLPLTRESGACVVTHAIDGLVAFKRVSLTVPDSWSYANEIVRDRVITLVYIDNSTAAGAFDEYRIESDDSGSGDQAGRVKVVGLDPIFDLAREKERFTAQLGGTISAVLSAILTHAPAIFVAGTVTPTHGAPLPIDKQMPMAALQALLPFANESADISTGQQYFARARRNGVTDYRVDIIELGSGADLPDIRDRKNLQGLIRRRQRQEVFTRLYMTAQGQAIVPWMKVTDVDPDVSIDIEIDGFPDLNPIYKDGAFAAQGLYWFHEDGTGHAITDEERANKRLTMASTTGIAVGEFGYIAQNAAGDPVQYLDDPDGARPIVNQVDININPGTNWLPNPRFENWTASVPDDWTDSTGLAWTEETTDTLFGSAAAAPTSGSVYILRPDGAGWAPIPSFGINGRSFYCREGDTITYTLWFKYSGVVDETGTTLQYFWDPNVNVIGGHTPLVSGQPGIEPVATAPDQWFESSHSYIVEAAGLTYLGWSTQKQDNVDFLLGGGCVTVTPRGQTAPVGFLEGASGARAWVRAINLLLNQGGAVYTVTMVDLSRYDSGTWPYDRLELGAEVTVTTALLDDTETLRVVQLEVDEMNKLDTRVTLAARWQTLTSQLFAALLDNFGGGSVQSVGTPVNLEPDEEPPPIPPPAASDGPFAMVGSTAGFPEGRVLIARGGTSFADTGPSGTLGVRSRRVYWQNTDPTLDEFADIAEGDIWMDGSVGPWMTNYYTGSAWTQQGWLVPDDGTEDYVLTWHADGYPYWAPAGAGSTIDVEDEGTPVGTFDTLNFIGASVTATDGGGGVADITITGGGGTGLTSYVAAIGTADDEDEDDLTLTFEPVLFYEEENDGGGEFTVDGEPGEIVVTTGGRYLVTLNARTSGGTTGSSQIINAYAECYASAGSGIYGALARVEDQETSLPEPYGAVLMASGEIRANAGDKIRCKLSMTRDVIGASNGWSEIGIRVTRLGD